MGSFDYIQKHYGIQIKRGARVEFTGDPQCGQRLGTVVSTSGAHINIRFDDDPKRTHGPFHPTWELRYLTT